MIVFDTDTLTLYLRNHAKVVERHGRTKDEVVITVISWIETLQGRFATLLKAADSTELQRGQERLDQARRDLATFRVLPAMGPAAKQFDRLRTNKKLRSIGRGDMLIAAITLANQSTLVTRNVRHFSKVDGLQVENWAD
ncbi:MAG TPA: type II toxin-antitoxin system VapC family toxin [Gemmataceae bacterium]|nr:type II toxin-antitoxin system VapC family toxin [Gemmataceae bacterium]